MIVLQYLFHHALLLVSQSFQNRRIVDFVGRLCHNSLCGGDAVCCSSYRQVDSLFDTVAFQYHMIGMRLDQAYAGSDFTTHANAALPGRCLHHSETALGLGKDADRTYAVQRRSRCLLGVVRSEQLSGPVG